MKARKKILIVEDDKAVIKPLAAVLRKKKLELLIAADGEAGLEMAQKEAPDLILLDIILPKMNGFEVLEKIRLNRKTKRIPVIILSNLAREGEIEKGISLGADEYFVKTNFSLAKLMGLVEGYLE